MGGFYLFSDYYLLMQSSYSFSRSTYHVTDLCYQEREIYSYAKDKLTHDEKDAVGVIYGPRGIGKSTFLKQFANNNPEVFYYEITDNNFEDSFKNFMGKLFISPAYHPIAWIYEIPKKILMVERPDFEKFKELFNSKSTSEYFKKNFGRVPLFIFDSVNMLQKSKSGMEKLLNLARLSSTSGYFHVILSGSEGWTPDYISMNLYKIRLSALQLQWEFTEEESYKFHKCLRKMDSEEIIKKTYSFIKGHPDQYLYFARHANAYPDPLSEDDYAKVISGLLGEIIIDFENSSIDFVKIYKNVIKHLKQEPSKILNSIKVMNLLINNKGPLPETEVGWLIDDEIMSGNVFKKYPIYPGKYLIDFQTNLHRVCASINMGYFNWTAYEVEWTFEQLKDSLKKNHDFEL